MTAEQTTIDDILDDGAAPDDLPEEVDPDDPGDPDVPDVRTHEAVE